MARRLFGGQASDFVANGRGDTLSGGTGTVYTAQTGGSQITDLLDANGNPVTTLSASLSPKGMVQFSGPNDGTAILWVDFGQGRVKMLASDASTDAGQKVSKDDLVFSVKDHGAAGNGSTDDTTAINATVTLAAAAGGVVYFPTGTYKVTSTITISSPGVFLQGAGAWKSKITRSGDYGDTFLFTGNDGTGAVLVDTGIAGLQITSTAQTTSGAHINLNGLARHTLRDIYLVDGFVGIKAAGVTASSLSRIYGVFTNIYAGSATGRKYMYFLSAAATYAHPSCGDMFVTDFNVRGNVANTVTEYGIEIRSADGLWFTGGHIGNTTAANLLLNAADASNPVGLVSFTAVMTDEGTGLGVLIQGATNTTRRVQFSNCAFKGATTGTSGVQVSSGALVNNVLFSNCHVSEFNAHGVILSSGKNFNFANCVVQGNSYTTPSSGSGYTLTNVAGVRITGGMSGGDNIDPEGTPKQSFGINVGAGCTKIVVSGVDLRNNVSGGLGVNAAVRTEVSTSGCLTSESASVAAATTTSLPQTGDVFTITGTTTITAVAASWANRRVTLIFAGILTFTDGSNLKLAGNLTTAADTTITLICDGTNWRETSRSAN